MLMGAWDLPQGAASGTYAPLVGQYISASSDTTGVTSSAALQAAQLALAASNPQGTTTLTSVLVSGTQYTSLAVVALSVAVVPGQSLLIANGQIVTAANAGAAVGATSIPTVTFTANANYAISTTVTQSSGGSIFFPQGVTWLTAGMVRNAGEVWRGSGRGATILRLAAGQNAGLVKSNGWAALTTTNSASGVAEGGYVDITFDGNVANQTSGCFCPNLAAPTITQSGTTGGQHYQYQVTVVTPRGETAGQLFRGVTLAGNATLSGSNYNILTWAAAPTPPAGETWTINVYGAKNDITTPTLIATGLAITTTTYNDQGATVSSQKAPWVNYSGDVLVGEYGTALMLANLEIKGSLGVGLRTEWSTTALGVGNGTDQMEASYFNLKIHSNNATGWENRGAHDSNASHILCFQNCVLDTTEYEYACGNTTNHTSIHTWGSSSTSQFGCVLFGGGATFGPNCVFENHSVAPLLIASNLNVVRGFIYNPTPGLPAIVQGVRTTAGGATQICVGAGNNDIDMTFTQGGGQTALTGPLLDVGGNAGTAQFRTSFKARGSMSSINVASCSWSGATTAVTSTNNFGSAGVVVGMGVYGVNIAPNTTVAAVSGTSLTLNQATLATSSTITLYFGIPAPGVTGAVSVIKGVSWSGSVTSITLPSSGGQAGVVAGQTVIGPGIAAGTTVSTISGTALTISTATTGTQSSVTLTFGGFGQNLLGHYEVQMDPVAGSGTTSEFNGMPLTWKFGSGVPWISGGTPTVTVGAAAGTGGSVAATLVAGQDTSLTVSVVTGASGQASGVLATVAFSTIAPYVPRVVLGASVVAGLAGVLTDIYVTKTNTGFVINTTGALASGTTYEFDISVV